ncbi:MAG: dihydrolipoyl dehydrogenase [Treponema sp.]|jgi:dihydrolipoamide dehydrogenase|nr:dihydrolipoyl dehydrogenase [Treponema sp.]
MAETQFDVAVIGGGPGGYVCAIRAARLGKKTALVESRELGGTCLNRGCIPTKTLLHTAELYAEMKNHGKELGIMTENLSVDYAALADRRDRIIARLRKGIESLVKGRRITILRGNAVLTGSRSFRTEEGEYTAQNIVIATGSEPAAVPVPGADRPEVINSDAVLAARTLPESVVIIGGGVIGVEFAVLFASLGRKVTIIEMLPHILNTMDESIRETQTKILKKMGVEIHTGARLLEILAGGRCVYEERGLRQEVSGGAVIMAAGRRPATGALGLEAAGVAVEKGFVTVDGCLRTNVPGIYAIGDVTGKAQLAHAASAQGLAAAANIAGKETEMRYDSIPACVYTNPEIASVGMTEARIKEAGLPYNTGMFPAAANGRSLIMGDSSGFVKLLTHRDTGEILGAHIMAKRATDMIGEIALAMRAEATVEELADTVHAHPSLSEMIMEAAHDAEGLCCHKP